MNTVPKAISPSLLAFCGAISDGYPTYIRSKPSADAAQSACFDNVGRKIERAGGHIVYGWAIWHMPGLYFEAEHHGVWCNRQGKLLDVSPQLSNASTILFLADPDAVYDPPNFRSNILKPVDSSARSTEFAALASMRIALIDSYRSDEYITASISCADQVKLGQIDRRMQELLRG